MADPKLQVVIEMKDGVSGVLSGLRGTLGDVGGVLGGVFKVGLVAAGAGALALAGGIGASIAAAVEAQGVHQQLAQVLKSTGGAAGVTQAAAESLSTSLMGVTRFEDEAILSGENMLLTFTNIGKGVFPQATETMLDMSQALGQDLKTSAIQLGKALNDPVKGVTALQRVGVTFDDQQKAQIKTLVASGKTMEAQKVILAELSKEFGGSARAAGETFAGKLDILRNKVGNVGETIGGIFIPVLGVLLDGMQPVIDTVGRVADAFATLLSGGSDWQAAFDTLHQVFGEDLGEQIGLIAVDIKNLFGAISGGKDVLAPLQQLLVDVFGDQVGNQILHIIDVVQTLVSTFVDAGPVSTEFSEALSYAFGPEVAQAISGIIAAVGNLASTIGTFVSEHAEALKAAFLAIGAVLAGAAVLGPIVGVVTAIGGIVTAISAAAASGGILAGLGAAIAVLGGPVILVIAAVALLAAAWTEDWGGIRETVASVWATVQPVLATLIAWLQVNIPIALQALAGFWTNTLQPAIAAVWSFIQGNVLPLLATLVEWLATNIPVALQALAGFWQNTLLPAITAVWSFISGTLIPLLSSLVSDTLAAVNAALTAGASFWQDVLLPAINAVWGFVNNSLIPLFVALDNVYLAAVNLALTAAQGFWQNVLLPAITAVWSFISGSLNPILSTLSTWLSVTLTGATQTLSDLWTGTLQPALNAVWSFISVTLDPILNDLSALLNGAVSSAVSGVTGLFDSAKGAIDGISGAINSVIGWLNSLTSSLNSIKLPDWLTPGSPTPFELGLKGISSAMSELARTELPAFRVGLERLDETTSGVSGGAYAPAAVVAGGERTIHNNLTIYSSAPVEPLVQTYEWMKSWAGA